MEPTSILIGAFGALVIILVPAMLVRAVRTLRLRGKVLLVVDDGKTGELRLVLVRVGDGSYTTAHQAQVRFSQAKSRRVTDDALGRYKGLTAYIADAHSGHLIDRVDTPEIEKINKEAAAFVASKAARELGSDPGTDLTALVRAAVILGSLTLLVVLIAVVAYFVTKPDPAPAFLPIAFGW